MANINNAQKIIFINAKNGSVGMAMTDGSIKGKKATLSIDCEKHTENAEVGALNMFIKTLVSMQDNMPRSALVFLNDQAARRVIEARKYFNQFRDSLSDDELVEAVVESVTKDWMGESQKASVRQMAKIMTIIWSNGLDISVVAEHTSHSWELNVPEGVEIKAGDKIKFVNGVDEENGITSWDTSYLEGEYTVRTNVFTDRNGVEHVRYFVPRQGNQAALRAINGIRDEESGKYAHKGLRQYVNDMLPQRVDITKVEFDIVQAFAS